MSYEPRIPPKAAYFDVNNFRTLKDLLRTWLAFCKPWEAWCVKSWRLNWAFGQIRDSRSFSKHRDTLYSPLQFWFALAVKLIPNVWKSPIHLRLRKGGEFDVNEFMTLFIYKEIFVDGCYDFPRLQNDRAVIIDIGANTGLFAIRMKQLYPRATLFCYEPLPSNFHQLRGNLRASKISDCATFQEGVGGSTRVEKLFIHSRNIGGHSIYADIAGSGRSIDISLIDMQTALGRLRGGVCNLLKLDCEGAEYEILKSLDKVAALRVERIIFEPTPAIYNVDELKFYLNEIGYDVTWNNSIFVALHRNLPGRAGLVG